MPLVIETDLNAEGGDRRTDGVSIIGAVIEQQTGRDASILAFQLFCVLLLRRSVSLFLHPNSSSFFCHRPSSPSARPFPIRSMVSIPLRFPFSLTFLSSPLNLRCSDPSCLCHSLCARSRYYTLFSVYSHLFLSRPPLLLLLSLSIPDSSPPSSCYTRLAIQRFRRTFRHSHTDSPTGNGDPSLAHIACKPYSDVPLLVWQL